MSTLYVDIETYSATNLKKAGVYAYTEDPEFQIMMAGYALDEDPVEVLVGDDVRDLLASIQHAQLEKVAHNAQFERVCFSAALGMSPLRYLDPAEWTDTMALAGEWGYPQSLDGLARALGTPTKADQGKALVTFFCKPYRGKRRRPEDHPEKWAQFVEYCRQDVVALREVRKALLDFPANERAVWEADQRINDRGIRLDMVMATAAERAADDNTARHKREFIELTGVENPASQPQVLGWFQANGLKSMRDITKETVAAKLAKAREVDGPKARTLERALELRQELALTASSKYTAARLGVSSDGRLRGQFKFFGAHTGRWSGRGVQLQNLPSRGMKELVCKLRDTELDDALRALGLPVSGSTEEKQHRVAQLRVDAAIADLKLGNGASPQALKELVRPLFYLDGVVVDYSAIEARVIAWLAGEEWALEAFAAGRDIYVETAQRMTLAMAASGREPFTRDEGKVAVLALGYQGAINSLRNMGAKGTDEELLVLVRQWRQTNARIVQLWQLLQEAFAYGGQAGRLYVEKRGADRHLRLPSGRAIVYHDVRVERYVQVDKKTKEKTHKTGLRFSDPRLGGARAGTYGGRLAENATQAVARDLLAAALVRLDRAGLHVVGHVHDEILVENTKDEQLVREIMCASPRWAAGLPVDGDGFQTARYRKG